jgi:hypothetical protein
MPDRGGWALAPGENILLGNGGQRYFTQTECAGGREKLRRYD